MQKFHFHWQLFKMILVNFKANKKKALQVIAYS